MFQDRVIMVTGGTGSFGSTVLQRLLNSDCGQIRIFSRDEKKQEEMRLSIIDDRDRVKFYIGDVRHYDSVCDAMRGVHYVFHAAALKQVPSCEFYPLEAVRTNILGAENVMRAAIANEVKRCVVLSTDKAVYPINAMGMSKALMEKAMIAISRLCDPAKTILAGTRYGNVMGSRGSVIPLFLEQLRSGKPLTVTDPRMTRFLMLLDESVDLVLYAFQHAHPGDIFVQKAPACTVADLAVGMRELLGKDNEIKIVGTRHGEKLHETLVSREEMARASDLGNYFRIPADARDLNYAKYLEEGEARITESDDYTSYNTTRLDVYGIQQLLMRLEALHSHVSGAVSSSGKIVTQE